MGNCIGLLNYRFFLQFLVYLTACESFILLIYLFDSITVYKNRYAFIGKAMYDSKSLIRYMAVMFNFLLTAIYVVFGIVSINEQVFYYLHIDGLYLQGYYFWRVQKILWGIRCNFNYYLEFFWKQLKRSNGKFNKYWLDFTYWK